MRATHRSKRILSIEPSPSGFGFVILESPSQLIDYGTREAGGSSKNAVCLRKIEALIHFYQPEVIVLEEWMKGKSLRSSRALHLLGIIKRLSWSRQIDCRRVSRELLAKVFAPDDLKNKHSLGLAVVRDIPDLASKVPPPRKPWMSEHAMIHVLMATARALAICC